MNIPKGQCEVIFKHLLSGHSITTLQAMHPPFNCCRLSERIRELEATGLVIQHDRMKVGKKTVTRYSYHKKSAADTMLIPAGYENRQAIPGYLSEGF